MGDFNTSDAGRPGFVGSNRPSIEQNVVVELQGRRPLYFSRYGQPDSRASFIEPNQLADRIMVTVDLMARDGTDMFRSDEHVRRPPVRPGSLGLFDLRLPWAAEVRTPFDTLNFFVPLSSFDDFAEERGATFSGLSYQVEHDLHDEVMMHLALAMAPALQRPQEVNTLFLDHCFLAMRDHLASAYAILSRRVAGGGTGLTPRQKRLAIDYMETFLERDMSLAEVAKACEMSVSSFGRAFKVTMGSPPHQWLIRRRVHRAKELLAASGESLPRIALLCGFYDQSHLTRVFTRQVGSSPHKWRREQD